MAGTTETRLARSRVWMIAPHAAKRRTSVIGLCVICASLAALSYSWYESTRIGSDYVGLADTLFPVCLFVSIPIGAIARIKGLLPALSYTLLTSAAACVSIVIWGFILSDFHLLNGPDGLWGLTLAVAAICPPVGLLVIRPTLATAGVGALATILGLASVFTVAQLADALWPMRLVELSAGGFAMNLSFGSIMGLTWGIAATLTRKRCHA